MRRSARTLILGMMLAGITATPLMSQATEQYSIGDVRVMGATKFSSDLITAAILGLVSGQVYNASKLRDGLANLKKLYAARGYVNFTATPVENIDEQKKVVNLTINIDEDRQFHIGHIVFAGNTTTSDNVIRRELLVKEGQTFNGTLWELSLSRINQLGYFEEIKSEDVQFKTSAAEPVLDIIVTVKEKERK